MPFDISLFKQSLASYGVGSSSDFDVTFTLPQAMIDVAQIGTTSAAILQFPDILRFRAEKVTEPGSTLMMNNSNKFGIGPVIKQPYNCAFSDVKMTFLSDSNGDIQYFFTFWQNLAYSFSQGAPQGVSTESFLSNYRDDFVAPSITINKYDMSGNIVNYIQLFRAFPTTVVPIQLDWDQSDGLIKVDVNFTYQDYSMVSN